MVKAGGKYLHHFANIDAEMFHFVEHDENKFWLSDNVTITTKSGQSITGEIVSIGDDAVDVLPVPTPARKIMFEDIAEISY